jgi:hypothetical protein
MKSKLNTISEKLIYFKNWRNVVAVSILGLGYLTSCTDTKAYSDDINNPSQPLITQTLKDPNINPNIEPTLPPTNTPTEIPTPIIEPILLPTQPSEVLPVNPPNFNQENQNLPHGSFDLIDAHAVYALYRQQEGPSMWSSDSEFIEAMEAYSNQLNSQGIELKQATTESITSSLLVKDHQIFLNFNQNGALRDVNPGSWSPESTSSWVDVGAEAELHIGEDNNSYIAKINQDGLVDAFLNPIGATLDNIYDQWIPVHDGLPNAIWNGKEWSTDIPIRALAGTFGAGFEIPSYTYLTVDELKEYPGQLTPADMRDPNLGPLIRQNLTEDKYGVWLVGRVVGSKSGYVYLDKKDKELRRCLELVIDIPDLSRKSALRMKVIILINYFNNPFINLPNLQTGTDQLRNLGIDPLSGNYDPNDLLISGKSLYINDSYTADQRMDMLQNNPEFIGSYFAFLIPNTSFEINRTTGEQKITPNLPLKILMNPDLNVDQNEINNHVFDYLYFAADPDNFQ